MAASIPTDGLRPLGPRTRAEYAAIVRLAFPKADVTKQMRAEVADWPEPRRVILRAAVRRKLLEMGADSEAIGNVISGIPKQAGYKPKRIHIPGEPELVRFTDASEALTAPQRAVVLLPLALGLRAAEVLTLPRRAVQNAIDDGILRFVRKGGKEGELPAEHVADLFRTLLDTEALNGKRWSVVGQILSQGSFMGQYRALWLLVRKVGGKAHLRGLRPHLLRHAFGTRMNRAGAPLLTIKEALGHASVTTTQRYVHPEADDVRRYMKKPI